MAKKNSNGVVSILIGTIIGAGFASGQEIVTFFVRYGTAGLYGLATTGILWILSLWALFYVVRKDRIHTYSELADILFGHEIGLCYQILVAIFMFLSLAVMLSGSGTLLKEQWGLPRWLGTLLMAMAVYLTILHGHSGLSIMNRLLVPFMIGGILLASSAAIYSAAAPSAMLCLEPIQTLNLSNSSTFQAAFHTLLYVSYNLISVVVIFAGILVPAPRRTAIITSIILTLLSLALGVATFINYGTIIEIEIPVPALLSRFTGLRWMYVILLLSAMYTTAIGNAYGCMEFLKKQGTLPQLLLIGSAALASGLGFTVLIDKGYTLFGYIGLLQLLLLLRRAVYHRRIRGR